VTTLETLAHDLRQPLAAILSNAQAAQQLLARGVPDLLEVREILEEIVSSDKRAAAILRRLEEALASPVKPGSPAGGDSEPADAATAVRPAQGDKA